MNCSWGFFSVEQPEMLLKIALSMEQSGLHTLVLREMHLMNSCFCPEITFADE